MSDDDDGDSGTGTASCAEFVARSFALRTAAHMAHLQAATYAHHVALDEFYTELLELVDQFAEVYQGLYGVIKDYPSQTPPTGEPLVFLVDFLDWAKQNYDSVCHEESALEAILDEILAAAARTLYKLRFLR